MSNGLGLVLANGLAAPAFLCLAERAFARHDIFLEDRDVGAVVLFSHQCGILLQSRGWLYRASKIRSEITFNWPGGAGRNDPITTVLVGNAENPHMEFLLSGSYQAPTAVPVVAVMHEMFIALRNCGGARGMVVDFSDRGDGALLWRDFFSGADIPQAAVGFDELALRPSDVARLATVGDVAQRENLGEFVLIRRPRPAAINAEPASGRAPGRTVGEREVSAFLSRATAAIPEMAILIESPLSQGAPAAELCFQLGNRNLPRRPDKRGALRLGLDFFGTEMERQIPATNVECCFFFSGVMLAVFNERFVFESIEEYLAPAAREYCAGWIRFSDLKESS